MEKVQMFIARLLPELIGRKNNISQGKRSEEHNHNCQDNDWNEESGQGLPL